MQTVTTFNMMTIWMCRRHDDFRSAAPIVEIAMQRYQRIRESGGGIIPSPKSGGPTPPPCSDACGRQSTVVTSHIRCAYPRTDGQAELGSRLGESRETNEQ